jgi:hypothetical protein
LPLSCVSPFIVKNLEIDPQRALHALDDQTAINRGFKPVMPNGLIGRAVVPGLRGLEGRDLCDYHALGGIAFQNFVAAVKNDYLDLVAFGGRPDLVIVKSSIQLHRGSFRG